MPRRGEESVGGNGTSRLLFRGVRERMGDSHHGGLVPHPGREGHLRRYGVVDRASRAVEHEREHPEDLFAEARANYEADRARAAHGGPKPGPSAVERDNGSGNGRGRAA